MQLSGFKPGSSGVGIICSVNRATTTDLLHHLSSCYLNGGS